MHLGADLYQNLMQNKEVIKVWSFKTAIIDTVIF